MAGDCGAPGSPQNGSLEDYNTTTEGSVVFYQCDAGLVPAGRMMAVCVEEGWSPDPAELVCSKQSSNTDETKAMEGEIINCCGNI